MSEKILYKTRKFLNKIGYHTGAYIIAEIIRYVSTYRSKKNKDKLVIPTVSQDYSITIADCSRIINLEFSSSTKGNYENSIKKLDLLIDTLKEFKDVMVTSYEEDEKLIKQGKLKRDKY